MVLKASPLSDGEKRKQNWRRCINGSWLPGRTAVSASVTTTSKPDRCRGYRPQQGLRERRSFSSTSPQEYVALIGDNGTLRLACSTQHRVQTVDRAEGTFTRKIRFCSSFSGIVAHARTGAHACAQTNSGKGERGGIDRPTGSIIPSLNYANCEAMSTSAHTVRLLRLVPTKVRDSVPLMRSSRWSGSNL